MDDLDDDDMDDEEDVDEVSVNPGTGLGESVHGVVQWLSSFCWSNYSDLTRPHSKR